MPDPYFSTNEGDAGFHNPRAASRVTAIIEIPEFSELVREEKIDILNSFYHELSTELYATRRENYCLGLRVLEPEIQIFSERIILSSALFLENELPELSSIAFKLFADFCNLTLSVAIKNEIALKGIANIGENYRGVASSGSMNRAQARESMVLSDILKVFSFEEVFPEGFGQKFMPPANIPYFYGKDISDSIENLSRLKDLGIYFPSEIIENPFAELAVYSDMLIETEVSGNKMFTCNWRNWVERHKDNFLLEDLEINYKELVNI